MLVGRNAPLARDHLCRQDKRRYCDRLYSGADCRGLRPAGQYKHWLERDHSESPLRQAGREILTEGRQDHVNDSGSAKVSIQASHCLGYPPYLAVNKERPSSKARFPFSRFCGRLVRELGQKGPVIRCTNDAWPASCHPAAREHHNHQTRRVE